VYQVLTGPAGFKKERVIEYLSSMNNDWLTLIGSGRAYENPSADWLDNVKSAHILQPFQAILCELDDPQNHFIDVKKLMKIILYFLFLGHVQLNARPLI
jgi:hypothetical protein